jgi:hypothetical protein
MTAMTHDGQRPRSGTRARRWALVVGVTVFVALYAGLAIAYLANGSQSVDPGDIDPPEGGVAVLVTARGINAATPEMDVDVEVLLSDGLLNGDGNPKEQLTLTIEPTLDDADIIWPTDRRVQVRSEKVTFDGDIQDWPFDQYASQLIAAAWVGTGADFRYVDTALYFKGSVQGWHLATGAADPSAGALLDVGFQRSIAIMLFGLSLVVVLIMLPVTCWIVGLKLYREDRLFEAGFLGWIAAMLFATIPIRNFFPGSPPPGSWVDVLVTLWVVVALTVALVIGMAAFIRHRRPNPSPTTPNPSPTTPGPPPGVPDPAPPTSPQAAGGATPDHQSPTGAAPG